MRVIIIFCVISKFCFIIDSVSNLKVDSHLRILCMDIGYTYILSQFIP